MTSSRTIAAAAVLAVAFGALPADAAKAPNPISKDSRIRQIPFDENQIYELVGTYLYATTIELGSDETVRGFVLGDTIAWQVKADGNRVFFKPTEPNAATNLTVVTSKRTYYFNLSSADAAPGRKAGRRVTSDATFVVRIVHPSATGDMVTVLPHAARPSAADARKDTSMQVSMDKVNCNYGWSGDRKAIPLQKVCDDGQFTWFRIADGAEKPIIQVVMPDGTPATVNARRQGQFMVAERLGDKFQLVSGPNGEITLCVQRLDQKS